MVIMVVGYTGCNTREVRHRRVEVKGVRGVRETSVEGCATKARYLISIHCTQIEP